MSRAGLTTSLLAAFLLALALLIEVHARRRQQDEVAGVNFGISMRRVDDVWRNDDILSVTIESYELAYMDRRTPRAGEVASIHLALGVIVGQEPVSMAQDCARFLGCP